MVIGPFCVAQTKRIGKRFSIAESRNGGRKGGPMIFPFWEKCRNKLLGRAVFFDRALRVLIHWNREVMRHAAMLGRVRAGQLPRGAAVWAPAGGDCDSHHGRKFCRG